MATGGLEEGGEAGKDARLPPLRRTDDPRRPFKRYQLKTDPCLGARIRIPNNSPTLNCTPPPPTQRPSPPRLGLDWNFPIQTSHFPPRGPAD